MTETFVKTPPPLGSPNFEQWANEYYRSLYSQPSRFPGVIITTNPPWPKDNWISYITPPQEEKE